jgi:hypothetical protein
MEVVFYSRQCCLAMTGFGLLPCMTSFLPTYIRRAAAGSKGFRMLTADGKQTENFCCLMIKGGCGY